MHLPKLFKAESYDLLKQIVRENAFASLISYNERIISTKAMMQLNDLGNEQFIIETHINRVNPLAKNLANGAEVLCDFLGAHTYISSSWYDHVNVSTWNYEAVQIYGKVEIMTDEELYKHLKSLTDFYEGVQKCPMNLEKMGEVFVLREMKGALGMKIIPTDVKIKQKLSQNRDETNKQLIINNLNESMAEMDLAIAQKMSELK